MNAKTQSPAAKVRASLKSQMGLTARQVSVRADHGSVNVTIKAPGIKRSQVEEIANQERRVRYDEVTQCILRGGNTFVSTRMAWELTEKPAAAITRWMETLEAGNSIHPVPGSKGLGVEGGDLGVSREDDWRFGIWGDKYESGCGGHSNLNGIAETIAAIFVENDRPVDAIGAH